MPLFHLEPFQPLANAPGVSVTAHHGPCRVEAASAKDACRYAAQAFLKARSQKVAPPPAPWYSPDLVGVEDLGPAPAGWARGEAYVQHWLGAPWQPFNEPKPPS